MDQLRPFCTRLQDRVGVVDERRRVVVTRQVDGYDAVSGTAELGATRCQHQESDPAPRIRTNVIIIPSFFLAGSYP